VREIRLLRSTWRGLETELRLGLHGHERGNPGDRQDINLMDYRASPRPYQLYAGVIGGSVVALKVPLAPSLHTPPNR
jgi:hypothetical protein